MDNLTTLEFPTDYQKSSDSEYLITNKVTAKGMIPGRKSSLSTESTSLARDRDQQVNEAIYRGVGTPVTVDMSTEDILDAADLNWEVAKHPVSLNLGERQVPYAGGDYFAIVRSDNLEPLGKGDLVTENWKIFQNRDAIAAFQNFCQEAGLQLERVGHLAGGEKVFATASLNEEFALPGNDTISGKLLLVNHHRRGHGIQVNLMALRKVCKNNLVMPVKTNGVVIAHNSNFEVVVPQVLNSAKSNFAEFQRNAETLVAAPLDSAQALAILIETFGDPQKELDRQPAVVRQCLSSFVNGTDKGSDLLSSYRNCWHLLNTITSHFNHDVAFKSSVDSHRSNVRQLNSLWLGTRKDHQLKAYKHLVKTAQTVAIRG